MNEVIGAAASSGAPLHIVHINSMCMKDAPECLRMIAGARARGLDITTEAYPYEAGMTFINSALFNPGWREKFGVNYSDLMLPNTGERLTEQRFNELHNSPQLFSATRKQADDAAIIEPLVMIASDGDPGHPRNAGTYSRVLARYVRSQHSLAPMDAIRKMTLMPAQRLERAIPTARSLGRMQEGAAADVVVFNPDEIRDRATYASPNQPSTGVRFVLVGGTMVVENGAVVPNTLPGRAITSQQ